MVNRNGHITYLERKIDEYSNRYPYFNENVQIYYDLYDDVSNETLRAVFSIFHFQLNALYGYMNSRLQNGHYNAHESRELLYVLDEIKMIQMNLKGTDLEFEVIPYHQDVIQKCQGFLQSSNGSSIPSDFETIAIMETQPIFNLISTHLILRNNRRSLVPTKMIGGGSYATVHKYKDEYYNRFFAIKRANNDLNDDEYQRFKMEFDTMQKLSSPYVVEVYTFDHKEREYIMEYVDETLDSHISKNNNKLVASERIGLVRQILKAFNYIHKKGVLHRDISTKNILIKLYDELKVVKVADFGLVKLPDSTLTKPDTEMKGFLNDPKLSLVGFRHYDIRHETYALVRLIYFVMTGKLTLGKYPNKEFQLFIEKGLSDNLNDRYQDVVALQMAFTEMVKTL